MTIVNTTIYYKINVVISDTMKYTHATIDEMKEYLFDTMMAISEHKDNWRLNAEDKNRLDNACSELNIVLEHLESY